MGHMCYFSVTCEGQNKGWKWGVDAVYLGPEPFLNIVMYSLLGGNYHSNNDAYKNQFANLHCNNFLYNLCWSCPKLFY
jgi:hypothetical protein